MATCPIVIFLLMLLLWRDLPKAWEAFTFILGILGGIVRAHAPAEPPKADTRE